MSFRHDSACVIYVLVKVRFNYCFLSLGYLQNRCHEHLAIPFVELVRGGSREGFLCIFCLLWITCLNIPTVTQA